MSAKINRPQKSEAIIVSTVVAFRSPGRYWPTRTRRDANGTSGQVSYGVNRASKIVSGETARKRADQSDGKFGRRARITCVCVRDESSR